MEIHWLVEWQKTRQALQVNSHNKGQMIEDITNTSRVNASRRLVIESNEEVRQIVKDDYYCWTTIGVSKLKKKRNWKWFRATFIYFFFFT